MLGLFRRQDGFDQAAGTLHGAISDRARSPVFFVRYRVPDTLDGRFDLFAVHGFVVLDALREQGEAGNTLGTKLATRIFAGFEDALRDLGISDFGMSRRIKAMADAFYGRLEVYRAALASDVAMADALTRNLYRGDETARDCARALAPYVRAAHARVAAGPVLDGAADFGPLPEAVP